MTTGLAARAQNAALGVAAAVLAVVVMVMGGGE